MLTSCPLASILATEREDVGFLELQGLLGEKEAREEGKDCGKV